MASSSSWTISTCFEPKPGHAGSSVRKQTSGARKPLAFAADADRRALQVTDDAGTVIDGRRRGAARSAPLGPIAESKRCDVGHRFRYGPSIRKSLTENRVGQLFRQALREL